MDFFTANDVRTYQTIDRMAQLHNQYSLQHKVSQAGSLAFLIIVLVIISCLYLGYWNRQRSEQKAIELHRQRIQSLERTWRMPSHQRS
jgi:Tfp pilus assembly protein PilO